MDVSQWQQLQVRSSSDVDSWQHSPAHRVCVIVGVFKSGFDLPSYCQCPHKYSMYIMLKTNTACSHVRLSSFTNKACWIHFTNTACWIYIANTACWMHCTNTACCIYTASWNIRIYSRLNCHIHIIQHVETSSYTPCWLAHYLTSMLNAYVSCLLSLDSQEFEFEKERESERDTESVRSGSSKSHKGDFPLMLIPANGRGSSGTSGGEEERVGQDLEQARSG